MIGTDRASERERGRRGPRAAERGRGKRSRGRSCCRRCGSPSGTQTAVTNIVMLSTAPHSCSVPAGTNIAQHRTAGTNMLMPSTAQLAYCQYRTGGTALRHPTALEVAYAASARGEINGESPLLWCKVYCTRASSHLIWAPGAAAPQPPGRSRKPKGPALRSRLRKEAAQLRVGWLDWHT
eukprot:932381-Rhodomonas_salina.2